MQFHSFTQLTPDKCKTLLIQALCNILMKCKDKMYRIITLPEPCAEAKDNDRTKDDDASNINLDLNDGETGGDAKMNVSASTKWEEGEGGSDKFFKLRFSFSFGQQSLQSQEFEWNPEEFHERLSFLSFHSIDEVEKYYSDNFHVLNGQYGVLLFMYTVLLTKVSGSRDMN